MRKITLLAFLSIAAFLLTNLNLPAVENDPQIATAGTMPLPVLTADRSANLVTRTNFEDHVLDLYRDLKLKEFGLDLKIFRLGMVGYYSLEKDGMLNNQRLLSIIDFSKPSTQKRFYTIDLNDREVKFYTYVAHGRNTGQNLATSFSNTPHSNQSSLGFFVTGETYVGSKGYSLRLDGKEKGVNDNIRSRAVVIHAADYVTDNWIKRYGRLGRSQGCPALPPHLNKKVIDAIKEKTAIFTYYPDDRYIKTSQYLKTESLFRKLDQAPIELATYSARQQS